MKLQNIMNNRSIYNNFSYMGLGVGVIIAVLSMQVIKGKWEAETIVEGLLIDGLIKSTPFLTNAETHSCAPNLVKSLNVKKSRNLRTYSVDGKYTKLRILANSEKEALCFSKAIIDEMEIFLNNQLEDKSKIYEMRVNMLTEGHVQDSDALIAVRFPDKTESTKALKVDNIDQIDEKLDRETIADITDIAEIAEKIDKNVAISSSKVDSNYIQQIQNYKKHMAVFNKIYESKLEYIQNVVALRKQVLFPTSIDRYLPISWRLVILIFFGGFGFVIGMLFWRYRSNTDLNTK